MPAPSGAARYDWPCMVQPKPAQLICLLALLGLTHPVEGAKPSGPAVLVISVDGMHPDYVLKADQYGLKIPTLRHILSDGVHASGVRGVLPTVTYPSHTTMMTGV